MWPNSFLTGRPGPGNPDHRLPGAGDHVRGRRSVTGAEKIRATGRAAAAIESM
jgi:hypothetical protein